MMVLTDRKPSRSRMRGLRVEAGANGDGAPSSAAGLRHGGGPFITGADSRFQAARVCSASPTLCVSYKTTRSRSGVGSSASRSGVAASAARTPSTARTTSSSAGAAMIEDGRRRGETAEWRHRVAEVASAPSAGGQQRRRSDVADRRRKDGSRLGWRRPDGCAAAADACANCSWAICFAAQQSPSRQRTGQRLLNGKAHGESDLRKGVRKPAWTGGGKNTPCFAARRSSSRFSLRAAWNAANLAILSSALARCRARHACVLRSWRARRSSSSACDRPAVALGFFTAATRATRHVLCGRRTLLSCAAGREDALGDWSGAIGCRTSANVSSSLSAAVLGGGVWRGENKLL